MSDIERIQTRYGIELPEAYLALNEKGHFDYESEAGYLWFEDHEWLPLDSIADYTFLEWQRDYKTAFVPFAKSGRRDEWGWRTDWQSADGIPVAFCERGPYGHGHSSNFETYLFRHMIELFSGAWLDDEPDVAMERLLKNIEIVRPVLPTDLMTEIDQLAQREWEFDDMDALWSVMTTEEAAVLVKARCEFDHLDERFLQEAPPE